VDAVPSAVVADERGLLRLALIPLGGLTRAFVDGRAPSPV